MDAFGFGDPDNREGHPEDICNLDGRRVVDHPGHELFGLGDGSAKWPHRREALRELLLRKIDRALERLWWQM